MSKKLKIQFWKAEKHLVIQILEQKGLPKFKNKGFVQINDSPWCCVERIDLRGSESEFDWGISKVQFDSNLKRDKFLQKVVNAITDELFPEKGELKAGEMCEVRDCEDEQWKEKKLITILPAQYEGRFIAEWGDNPSKHTHWNYARPIHNHTKPIVEECGQLITYTWEEK